MKKQVRLSTQTRHILLCVFSIVGGIICLDTFDVTNLLYWGEDSSLWWKTRIVVFKMGVLFLFLSLKTFEGSAKFNLLLNCFIWICVSDIIGRFTGDSDRDVYDWIWTLITILFCYYEYRKRRLCTG
jgi:hypothetical protein